MYTFLKTSVYINENIMKTTDKLKLLFDYQEFAKDSDFVNMKIDAENYRKELTDEELVAASGGKPNLMPIITCGIIVQVLLPSGTASGKIVDVRNDEVLIENIGWVNKNNICQ